MKRVLSLVIFLFCFGFSFAQSNKEIANIYIMRSNKSFEANKIDESLEYFQKALSKLDTVTDANIADLGIRIYYKKNDYKKAKSYAEHFFDLSKNKNSKLHKDNLNLYVTILEKLEEQEEAERKKEAERQRIAKEKARIDSLKGVWSQKALNLSITANSFGSFNKNGIGLVESNEGFAIIDDLGNTLLEAGEYKNGFSYEGFIILMDKKENPTKIYCYNSSTKEGVVLPSVTDFSATSTHYGQVMLPRENGVLVTYPNNSLKAMVYDLNANALITVTDEKELFKTLKKRDKIERYNSDGQVRLRGEYYNFGGHLGGGIYPFYDNDFKIITYLFSVNGNLVSANTYTFLGGFYEGTIQAIKEGKTVWLDQNGEETGEPASEMNTYAGATEVKKLENGNYQLMIDGIIVKGEKTLKPIDEFIKDNSPKK